MITPVAGGFSMVVVFACGDVSCSAHGEEKLVLLQEIAPGFIDFPHLVLCAHCGHAVSIVDYASEPVDAE